jgi:hypothetical protein
MDINIYLLNELQSLGVKQDSKQKAEIQNMYHSFAKKNEMIKSFSEKKMKKSIF